MKFSQLMKNKQFILGLVLGIIFTAIAATVIGWAVIQRVKNYVAEREALEAMVPISGVPIENPEFEKETEEMGLLENIVEAVVKKDVKFLGMEINTQKNLQPIIEFRFNKELQTLLDEERKPEEILTFSPALEGKYIWSSPQTLTMTVTEALQKNTTYTGKFQTDLLKTAGVKLLGNASVEFETGGAIEAKIIEIKPMVDVKPRSSFTFTFSEEVAHLEEVGQMKKDEHIQFHPPISGTYHWINMRQIRFIPDQPLKPATEYQVTVHPEILDSPAYFLKETSKWKVATETFQVLDSKLSLHTDSEENLTFSARITFNYPVDPVELKKYLSVELVDSSNTVPLYLEIKEEQSAESFEISAPLVEGDWNQQAFRFMIKDGLHCQVGSMGLEKNYVKEETLSLLDSLKIYGLSAESNYTQGTIRVDFSRPIDPESAEAFITVTPGVSHLIKVYDDYVQICSEGFKPGETFQVTVKAGLPGKDAQPLPEEFTELVTIPNLEPFVRFSIPGMYLPIQGNQSVDMETVNVNQLEVGVYRIFANNLVHFLQEYNDNISRSQINNLGQGVDEFTRELENERNEIIKTNLPLADYFNSERKGIYHIIIRDGDNSWRYDSKVVLATDLGIAAKLADDQLLVWVNSLKTLEPIIRAKVSLISHNNQVLASGETDRNGLIQFTDLSQTFSEFEPYLILVENGQDFSFLKFQDNSLDVTDFDVLGRSHLTAGYESYMYTDRGVYQPGDTVHLVTIIRGPAVSLPPEFPIKLKVLNPAGNIYQELIASSGQVGAGEFELELPDGVKTGQYTGELYVADTMIGTTSFHVEALMPDRMKVKIQTDQDHYSRAKGAEIEITAVNAIGSPTVNRQVDLAVKITRSSLKPKGFASYTLGDPEEVWDVVQEVIGSAKLNQQGQYTFAYTFPEKLKSTGPLKTTFTATVREDGGRGVSAEKTVLFHPVDTYIGMKRLGDYYGKVNEPYQLQYVEVDQEGKMMGGSMLQVDVYRLIWHTLSDTDEKEKIMSQELEPGYGEMIFSFTPREHGEYKIVITNPETGAKSVQTFYVTGWGYAPWAMNNPSRIDLTLNQNMYEPDTYAKIQVKAPFVGKALVTVEREKVYDYQVIDFKENTGVIALHVKKEWAPNVYVTVQLIRSINGVEEHAPLRAFGTIRLPIHCGTERLGVNLTAPEFAKPGEPLKIGIEVPGASETARVTLAAVNEQALQLTNFQSPNPFDFFYGNKRLDVRSYDLYDKILLDNIIVSGKNIPGGDDNLDEPDSVARNLNTIGALREKPVSLWSGIVDLDGEGKAELSLNLPQFNGNLRLMAVAFDKTRFGFESVQVIVRDPIVLIPAHPRFISDSEQKSSTNRREANHFLSGS